METSSALTASSPDQHLGTHDHGAGQTARAGFRPPDNSCGYRLIQAGSKPTRCIMARTRPRTVSPDRCGSRVLQRFGDGNTRTGMRGSRLARGSWNTIWKSSRSLRMIARAVGVKVARPATPTRPPVLGVDLQHGTRQVDLPHPLSPTTPNVSPRCSDKADAVHGAQDMRLSEKAAVLRCREADSLQIFHRQAAAAPTHGYAGDGRLTGLGKQPPAAGG